MSCISTASLPYLPNTLPALDYSSENQYLVVTKQEIHILTPALGYASNSSGVQHSGLPKGSLLNVKAKAGENKSNALPLFRTSISCECEISWEYFSNDVRNCAPIISGIIPVWKSAKWSPASISANGTCLIAAANNNDEISIFGPQTNPFTGQWHKYVTDPTIELLKLVMPLPLNEEEEASSAEYRLKLQIAMTQVQTTAYAWSKPLRSSAMQDRHLLACAHRSGHVTFWTIREQGAILLKRIYTGPGWIDLIEFGYWMSSEGTACAYFAAGKNNGAVKLFHIEQDLSEKLVSDSHDPIASLDEKSESVLKIIPVAEHILASKPCAGLHWANIPANDRCCLVVAQVGVVHAINMSNTPTEAASSSTLASLLLHQLRNWAGMTPWAPCMNIQYLPGTDSCLIALSSSAFYIIQNVSTAPFIDCDSEQSKSHSLTKQVRSVWLANEAKALKNAPTMRSYMRTFGVNIGLDGKGLMSWIYQVERPDMLVYRAEAKVATDFMIVSDLIDLDDPIAQLEAHVEEALSPLQISGSTVLLPTYRYLDTLRSKGAEDDASLDRLLDSLKPASSTADLPLMPGDVSTKFAAGMYRDPVLRRLSLQCSAAQYACKAFASTPWIDQLQTAQDRIVRALANRIVSCLAEVMRQSGLEASSSNPGTNRICHAATALRADMRPEEPYSIAPLPSDQEVCPACQATVPFDHLRQATCTNGHIWERCAITLAIIRTMAIKTCTSCDRKVMLPFVAEEAQAMDVDGEKDSTEEQLIRQVLKAAVVCTWCGDKFVMRKGK